MTKSIILMLILVLISIFLFAGSGVNNNPDRKPLTVKPELQQSNKPLPQRTDLLFAVNDVAMHTPQTNPSAENKIIPAAPSTDQPVAVHKLSLIPKDNDAELWVQPQQEDANLKGQELQIFNSAGERVYYSKFETNIQKVDLCRYKGGKYLIKVGDQVYSLMII